MRNFGTNKSALILQESQYWWCCPLTHCCTLPMAADVDRKVAAINRTDRRMDTWPLHRPCAACCVGCINNSNKVTLFSFVAHWYFMVIIFVHEKLKWSSWKSLTCSWLFVSVAVWILHMLHFMLIRQWHAVFCFYSQTAACSRWCTILWLYRHLAPCTHS